jgi:hypothetical protein
MKIHLFYHVLTLALVVERGFINPPFRWTGTDRVGTRRIWKNCIIQMIRIKLAKIVVIIKSTI